MSQITRVAGFPFVIDYTTSVVPSAPPELRVFLDAGFLEMHSGPYVPETVRSNMFRYTMPEFPTGSFYLQFTVVAGTQTFIDDNDTLLVVEPTGEVGSVTPPVRRLRRMTGEPTATHYSDEEMQEIIDRWTDLSGVTDWLNASLEVWIDKSARYASMSDIVESGAERKLSQLYKNAEGHVKRLLVLIDRRQREGDAATKGVLVAGRSSKIWEGDDHMDRVLHEGLGPRA